MIVVVLRKFVADWKVLRIAVNCWSFSKNSVKYWEFLFFKNFSKSSVEFSNILRIFVKTMKVLCQKLQFLLNILLESNSPINFTFY